MCKSEMTTAWPIQLVARFCSWNFQFQIVACCSIGGAGWKPCNRHYGSHCMRVSSFTSWRTSEDPSSFPTFRRWSDLCVRRVYLHMAISSHDSTLYFAARKQLFLSAVSADIGVRCSECSPRPPARLPAASRQLSVPSPSSSPISAATFALRPSPLFCPSKRFNSDQKSVRWFLGLLLLRRFMANIRFAFEAAAAAAAAAASAAGQPSALLARNARTHAHGDLAINFPAAMTMPDPAPSIYDVRKF